MTPYFGHVVGVMIVLLMAVFVGIWIWAWRPRHKATFDALAEIPMREAAADAFTDRPGSAERPRGGLTAGGSRAHSR